VILHDIKVGEHVSTHTFVSFHLDPLGIALVVVGIVVLLSCAVVLLARRRRRAQVSDGS
jgi:hypothetical protein